jgi:hypothetical protein
MPGDNKNHGGGRKNAGRMPAFVKGQQTIFGGAANAAETKKRKDKAKNERVSVEEARPKKQRAAKNAAQQARLDEQEQQRTSIIFEEQQRQREADEKKVEGKLRLLAEAANAKTKLRQPSQTNDTDPSEVDPLEDEDSWSDDDEDWSDDEQENNNKSETVGNRQRAERNSSKYKPPSDSPLGKYLQKKRDEIVGSHKEMLDGKHWYPPEKDPVLIGNRAPIDWYEANTWIYCFSPLKQYSQLVKPVSEYNCIHCGKAGNLRSNGWHYRPMHHFHFTVWLLHRRLRCEHARGKNGCGRTFTEYDQDFLSQVPTPVAECFPFVTVRGGLGIHEALLYQFMYLVMKGVLFGSWCQSINTTE